jgi:hypothetical protein
MVVPQARPSFSLRVSVLGASGKHEFARIVHSALWRSFPLFRAKKIIPVWQSRPAEPSTLAKAVWCPLLIANAASGFCFGKKYSMSFATRGNLSDDDARYWAQLPTWSAVEAVALSLGKRGDIDVSRFHCGLNEMQISRRMRQIAIKNSDLDEAIRPADDLGYAPRYWRPHELEKPDRVAQRHGWSDD